MVNIFDEFKDFLDCSEIRIIPKNEIEKFKKEEIKRQLEEIKNWRFVKKIVEFFLGFYTNILVLFIGASVIVASLFVWFSWLDPNWALKYAEGWSFILMMGTFSGLLGVWASDKYYREVVYPKSKIYTWEEKWDVERIFPLPMSFRKKINEIRNNFSYDKDKVEVRFNLSHISKYGLQILSVELREIKLREKNRFFPPEVIKREVYYLDT